MKKTTAITLVTFGQELKGDSCKSARKYVMH